MKSLIMSAVVLLSVAAFAKNYPGFRQLANGYGTVSLTSRPDLKNKGMSIVISGPAAQVMFDKLSNDLLQSVDASERANHQRLVWKEGKNIYCSVEEDGKDNYECSIEVQDNSTGEIAEPGVG